MFYFITAAGKGSNLFSRLSPESTMHADAEVLPRLVRDLMTVGVATCPPQTPLAELARLLLRRDLEGVVVLDGQGHAVGVVTREEAVRGYAHPQADRLTAERIMRVDIPEVPPDIPLEAAAHLLRDQGTRVAFLMHNDQGISWPSAMISYTHFLRHLAAESPEDLQDLGHGADRVLPLGSFKRSADTA